MTVTLDIPDEIASQLTAPGQELSRAALEALALEAYRRGALSQLQVGRLLGLARIETEDFLAQHLDLYDYGRPSSSGKLKLWPTSPTVLAKGRQPGFPTLRLRGGLQVCG